MAVMVTRSLTARLAAFFPASLALTATLAGGPQGLPVAPAADIHLDPHPSRLSTTAGDRSFYLPLTMARSYPRGWALLQSGGETLSVGGMVWCELQLRSPNPVTGVDISVYFDASRLAVVDENPLQTGIQVLAGDWPPAGGGYNWSSASNSSGWLRVSAWSFAPSSVGPLSLARFRVRGRYPGQAALGVRNANWQDGMYSGDLSTDTGLLLTVREAPP